MDKPSSNWCRISSIHCIIADWSGPTGKLLQLFARLLPRGTSPEFHMEITWGIIASLKLAVLRVKPSKVGPFLGPFFSCPQVELQTHDLCYDQFSTKFLFLHASFHAGSCFSSFSDCLL